jgi:hypothetical protein
MIDISRLGRKHRGEQGEEERRNLEKWHWLEENGEG